MKKVLLVLFTILCLNACGKQKEANVKTDVSQKEDSKLENGKRMLIEQAFNAYITFDTNYLITVKKIDKANNLNDIDRDKIVEEVRLISLEGLKLLKKDSLKQVMDLLDREMEKFYLHPANTVENELSLHSSSIVLYDIFCEKEEFLMKSILLLDHSLTHIEYKHSLTKKWDEKYIVVLTTLTNFYYNLGANEKAISHAERLCKYIEDIGEVNDNEIYYNNLSLLKDLYEESNNKTKADICQRKLDKLN